MLHWKDAVTGEHFLIDSRTGHSYPQTQYWAHQLGTVDSGFNCGEGRRTLRKGAASTMAKSHSTNSTLPEWLERALQVRFTRDSSVIR
jgi:hypothetical protein